jgi:hypothetical protein
MCVSTRPAGASPPGRRHGDPDDPDDRARPDVPPVPDPAVHAGGTAAAVVDERQVFRVLVDVLAAPEQVDALLAILGTAVCGLPDDHDGACRLAWRMAATGPGRDVPVLPEVDREVRAALSALEAWPAPAATADLFAEVAAQDRPAGCADRT